MHLRSAGVVGVCVGGPGRKNVVFRSACHVFLSGFRCVRMFVGPLPALALLVIFVVCFISLWFLVSFHALSLLVVLRGCYLYLVPGVV